MIEQATPAQHSAPARPGVAGRARAAVARAWRAWGPWAIVAGMALVVGMIGLVIRGSAMVHAKPAWWRTVSAEESSVVESAQTFENALITQLHMRRDAGTNWEFAVRPNHVNSWLSKRLPKWVAGQVRHARDDEPLPAQDEAMVWPSEIAEVQMSFEGEHIRVGACIRRNGMQQYVSATLAHEIRGDGSLWLVARRVHIGRLGMPAKWVLDEAEGRADELLPEALRGLPEAETVFEIFSGERPFSVDPEIRLGDGRRVRLLRLWVQEDGSLAMRFRTIVPEPTVRASAGEG